MSGSGRRPSAPVFSASSVSVAEVRKVLAEETALPRATQSKRGLVVAGFGRKQDLGQRRPVDGSEPRRCGFFLSGAIHAGVARLWYPDFRNRLIIRGTDGASVCGMDNRHGGAPARGRLLTRVFGALVLISACGGVAQPRSNPVLDSGPTDAGGTNRLGVWTPGRRGELALESASTVLSRARVPAPWESAQSSTTPPRLRTSRPISASCRAASVRRLASAERTPPASATRRAAGCIPDACQSLIPDGGARCRDGGVPLRMAAEPPQCRFFQPRR